MGSGVGGILIRVGKEEKVWRTRGRSAAEWICVV